MIPHDGQQSGSYLCIIHAFLTWEENSYDTEHTIFLASNLSYGRKYSKGWIHHEKYSWHTRITELSLRDVLLI